LGRGSGGTKPHHLANPLESGKTLFGKRTGGRFKSFEGMSIMASDWRRSGWGSHFMSFHVISVISIRGGRGEMMK
jgi:hypothetical protein